MKQEHVWTEHFTMGCRGKRGNWVHLHASSHIVLHVLLFKSLLRTCILSVCYFVSLALCVFVFLIYVHALKHQRLCAVAGLNTVTFPFDVLDTE